MRTANHENRREVAKYADLPEQPHHRGASWSASARVVPVLPAWDAVQRSVEQLPETHPSSKGASAPASDVTASVQAVTRGRGTSSPIYWAIVRELDRSLTDMPSGERALLAMRLNRAIIYSLGREQ